VRKAARLPLDVLAPYLLAVPEQPGPLAWPAIFGNEHPVEVEVGFGKGLFLLTSSQALPQVNFLGIEVFRKYQLHTATRLAKRGLTNVRLVCGDARTFLAGHVAAESIQAVHVYFPDPWWKKRHVKRRLFQPDFAVTCERILRCGGRLHVVTDVESYFEHIVETLMHHTRLRRQPPEPTNEHDCLTNFERKYRLEGRPIYRASYVKPEGPGS
jgi:tRNA (guanine-N7-)-methyltransferase